MNCHECKKQKQIQKFIEYADRWWGIYYKYGGNSINGIDCSAFVCNVLRSMGFIHQGRDYNVQMLWNKFSTEDKNISHEPSRGAMVFWFEGGVPVHIGICIDEETTIQAARGNSDMIDEEAAIENNAFVDFVPLNYRTDRNTRFINLFK